MTGNADDSLIPFAKGAWILERDNPGHLGQYTGEHRKAGPHVMVGLQYPNGEVRFRPLACLELQPSTSTASLGSLLAAGRFGSTRDLQRLVTYEKLKGTLHEVIYSMEAAQIDFYPYQFKPVLKFIQSPTDRLIIADEVGLGKTIESALIWVELKARRQAQRLLVVCPKILAEKWRDELRTKFLLDARIADFKDLSREIDETRLNGAGHAFVLIATYSGLRPPKSELRRLSEPLDGEDFASPKTDFLRWLRHWTLAHRPFDLVIFDEAHYMRNSATTTFRLGETLAASAGAVLCVSATPVNNSNADLRSLLRLVDEDFFESDVLFNDLLEANRPTVQLSNALARPNVDMETVRTAVAQMGTSRFINDVPLYETLREAVARLDPTNKAELAQCQNLAEKLNMLGQYVNRTRRVQVKENRPLRVPVVLEVDYSPEEMRLYKSILHLVRRQCERDNRPFHVFRVLQFQLRAASCLPAIVQECREGRLGNLDELLDEAVGGSALDEFADEDEEIGWNFAEIVGLLNYDFEAHDTKYAQLRDCLLQKIPDEKVLIFAFYHRTLDYLYRRLRADGISVTVIHGRIDNDQRWREIERFRDPGGPRVLLSSEVGSEGIDLQFCRVLVNYDMPWNPMRVEQRIGRVDRVGQQSPRISIVNFKIRDTIEERLYDRLHMKLERFANSLGDLDDVIGQEVKQLTIAVLSRELTPVQEAQLIDQSERVIEERLLQIQALEDSGEVLVGLSDYVQRKIEEDRHKGRYIRPDELEDYVSDFFEREYRGCAVSHNTPAPGCLKIQFSHEAQCALAEFMEDDRSLSARQLRQHEVCFTFRSDVHQRLAPQLRGSVHFINHLSPLVRWITSANRDREHAFFSVSALRMSASDLPPGDYCYRIERWRMTGLTNREQLAYGVRSLVDGSDPLDEEAESVLQRLLHNSEDWTRVDCDLDALSGAHFALERELELRFSKAVDEFEGDNATARKMKTERVQAYYDRRIKEDEQRLSTLRDLGREARIINLTQGRLDAALRTKEQSLAEIEAKARTDIEMSPIAAGVFRII
jgi:superfamily II DNA or RNA helicase